MLPRSGLHACSSLPNLPAMLLPPAVAVRQCQDKQAQQQSNQASTKATSSNLPWSPSKSKWIRMPPSRSRSNQSFEAPPPRDCIYPTVLQRFLQPSPPSDPPDRVPPPLQHTSVVAQFFHQLLGYLRRWPLQHLGLFCLLRDIEALNLLEVL